MTKNQFWRGSIFFRFFHSDRPLLVMICTLLEAHSSSHFLFSLSQMPQCHSNRSKLLQHHRCNSGQLTEQTQIWGAYVLFLVSSRASEMDATAKFEMSWLKTPKPLNILKYYVITINFPDEGREVRNWKLLNVIMINLWIFLSRQTNE